MKETLGLIAELFGVILLLSACDDGHPTFKEYQQAEWENCVQSNLGKYQTLQDAQTACFDQGKRPTK